MSTRTSRRTSYLAVFALCAILPATAKAAAPSIALRVNPTSITRSAHRVPMIEPQTNPVMKPSPVPHRIDAPRKRKAGFLAAGGLVVLSLLVLATGLALLRAFRQR